MPNDVLPNKERHWDELNPRMYIDNSPELIVAFNLKSGSQSIKDKYSGDFMLRSDVAKDPRHVLLFMRDPIERFLSGWRYFAWDRASTHLGAESAQRLKHCTAEAWFHWCTEEEQNNLHWVPVTVVHTHMGEFLPDEVRPLYSLAYKKNQSSGDGRYGELIREEPELWPLLNEFYHDDLRLWRDVVAHYEETGCGYFPRVSI